MMNMLLAIWLCLILLITTLVPEELLVEHKVLVWIMIFNAAVGTIDMAIVQVKKWLKKE